MLKIDTSKKARARKQAGFIVTVELLLITVVLVVGLVTGMTKLRDQTIAELSDAGSAIGAINNSYSVFGTNWVDGAIFVAGTSSWGFADAQDLAASGPGGVVGGDTQFVHYSTIAPFGAPGAAEIQAY